MTRNILFVDCSTAHGGAQRSLYTLITQLDRDRYLPHLLCGNDSLHGLLKQCRRREIHSGFVSIRSWRRNVQGLHHAVVDLVKAKPIVNRWLEKHKIDLVYANGIQSGLLCAMSIPKEMPLIFHNRDFRGPKTAFGRVLKRANRAIMVSDFLLDHWRQLFPDYAEKMVRVYNGFNFEQMQKLREGYNYREQRGWKSGVLAVSVLADLMPWKRQDLFLEAFAKVREKHPDAFAFIIGGTRDEKAVAYEQKLTKLADKLNLTQHLAFTGHVDNPFPLIDASDVMVSTAENEPFGRTIVESLFCGKPIVACDTGGPAEIGQGCCAVHNVPPTADALADAILACASVSVAGRGRVADAAITCARRFTVESHVQAITQILDECLNPA